MSKVPRAWNFNIDFIGHMNAILWVSAIATTLSIACVLIRGFNFGTDFAGGYEIQVQFPSAVSETQIRNVLAPIDLDDARVQRFGNEGENAYLILVRGDTAVLSAAQREQIRQKLVDLAGSTQALTTLAFAESGESMQIGFAQPQTQEAVQGILRAQGVVVKSITAGERSDRPEFNIALESLADRIAKALVMGLKLDETKVSGDQLIRRIDFVGPQVGAQLRNEGMMAVALSLFLILIYVGLRFDLFFSPGAIVATLHDIIITMGIFSLTRIEFNVTVVAAVLTLIGYSLNDTIVVYDRIREDLVRLRGRELRALVNTAINETLSRTILTSVTVFLVTGALLVLGGPSIRGFSVTMLIGVVVGAYSSIAVASPVYILLRERAQGRPRQRKSAAALAS